VISWFKKEKNVAPATPVTTDIHSHLLPGLDDGVSTFEQAEEIVLHFKRLGYTKIITSPHVISDSYRNTSEGIQAKLSELKTYLEDKQIDITVEAAAEYYLDEQLYAMIEGNQPLLTFGKKYLLFETNFLTEPFNLKEFIFLATTKGYKPVLAHPERYIYMQNNLPKLEDLQDRGVLFQVNISSITGYYSKEAQATAHKLIDRGWVQLLGSDCHSLQHIKLLEEARRLKYFQKALSLPLLNNSL
jgi:tyrosine-protein phosphatase YwqE